MFKIGVMASGGGSNFKAIIDKIGEGELDCQCKFLITNNGGCGAVEHASEYGIPVHHISGKTHPVAADYEAAMMDVLDKYNVDLLILAGYMKALPSCMINRMPDRIMNIHPSLLPKYGGKGFWGIHVHEAVLAAHEKESGPTVHLVSEEIDRSPCWKAIRPRSLRAACSNRNTAYIGRPSATTRLALDFTRHIGNSV